VAAAGVAVNIRMTIIKGEIVLTFGQNVGWVGFSPSAARELGENLIKLASEAEKADASKPAGISIQ
jgi:hypothetical protein